MNKRLLFYRIASSLVFALVTMVLSMVTGCFSAIQSIGIAALVCALQFALWKLTRKCGFISYAIAFFPSASVVMALLRTSSIWYGVALGTGLAIALVPGRKLPLPRPSTSIWVGILLFMVEVALMVGVVVA